VFFDNNYDLGSIALEDIFVFSISLRKIIYHLHKFNNDFLQLNKLLSLSTVLTIMHDRNLGAAFSLALSIFKYIHDADLGM